LSQGRMLTWVERPILGVHEKAEKLKWMRMDQVRWPATDPRFEYWQIPSDLEGIDELCSPSVQRLEHWRGRCQCTPTFYTPFLLPKRPTQCVQAKLF
jgi:hypothetical protein